MLKRVHVQQLNLDRTEKKAKSHVLTRHRTDCHTNLQFKVMFMLES